MKSEQLWTQVLEQLELQMTKATFNRWLKNSRVLAPARDAPVNGRIVVGLESQYALDWVKNRLGDTVSRTVEAMAQRPLVVEYRLISEDLSQGGHVVPEPPEMPPPDGYSRTLPPKGEYGGNLSPDEREALVQKIAARERGKKAGTAVVEELFPGFEPLDSNWTQTPDSFFTWVLPNAPPVVSKLVGQVIFQTLGTFEDKRRNRRREEWPVNNTVLQRVAGISSPTSLKTVLWDARNDGYVILRQLDDEERKTLAQKMGYRPKFTLRIRYPDDTIDTPDEPRPGYGTEYK